MKTKKRESRLARMGATTVEFALVFPLLLTTTFFMLETLRMATISETVTTSLLAGAREASVAVTNADTVRHEMELILAPYGVRDLAISVTPSVIDSGVGEVSIDIEVPLNASNGIFFMNTLGARNVQASSVVTR